MGPEGSFRGPANGQSRAFSLFIPPVRQTYLLKTNDRWPDAKEDAGISQLRGSQYVSPTMSYVT